MVLSNRKLKQKLREKLAHSLVQSVAKTDPNIDGLENSDPKSKPPSLKVLLDIAAQKPRLSKREKRRKLLALLGSEAESGSGSGGNLEEDKGEVGSEVVGDEKKKKRKRDEEDENGDLSSGENGVVKETMKSKKKQNKKKKKKRKKEAKTEELKKDVEIPNEDQSVKETDNNIDRQAVGYDPTKVSVGGIPLYSTEDDIRSYFESCGTITKVDCLRFPDSGIFRGVAILSFKTEAAAKRALALDGAGMGELFLKVQPCKTIPANEGDTETGESRGYVHVNVDRQAIGDVPTKVYVGGIPYYSTEDDIRRYFESCGTITEVDCLRFSDSGKFRGIAILTFKTETAAKQALALDGAEMGELFLKVQPCKTTRANKVSDFNPQIVEGYNRIYVGNLSWDITEDDLRKLFSDCKISSINFGKDKESGEFRGYAHVNFSESLSLTMSLKLDQTVVCGRPVKISCAVPLRKAGPRSTSGPTTSSTRQISAGATTHSDSIPVATITSTEADNGGSDAITGKIKRRTCYGCGEKGHLSSACPKSVTKTSSTHSIPVSTSTADHIPVATTKSTTLLPEAATPGTGSDYGGLSTVSGNIKRRTCYGCGEKGHLSSACPKSATATATSNTHSISVPTTTSTDLIPTATDTHTNWTSAAATTGTEAENGGLSASSGKIKRRTCYECGEKGHISAACPKSATTSSTHSVPVPTSARTNPIPVPTTTSTDMIPKATSTGTGVDNGGLSAISGKIKRRTCYECGEKGHISSACPKKQSGDPMDTNAS